MSGADADLAVQPDVSVLTADDDWALFRINSGNPPGSADAEIARVLYITEVVSLTREIRNLSRIDHQRIRGAGCAVADQGGRRRCQTEAQRIPCPLPRPQD